MERRDRQHRAAVLFICECVLFPTVLMKHLQSAGPRHAPRHKTVLLLWVPHRRYSAQPAAGVHVVSENKDCAQSSLTAVETTEEQSVKQVGNLPDGCQQGRFGGAFRCVEDPVRRGQTHWAVTEKYQWLQQGLQNADFTWCGYRHKKWELGFLCRGRNMRWLYLNYVLVAQRRPCSWTSEICCHKSLPSYGKDQNIHRQKVKLTGQKSELTSRKPIPEISDVLVFCHKEVLFVYRVDVNATQNLSIEWVERLVRVPVVKNITHEVTREQESYCCLINPQKELK